MSLEEIAATLARINNFPGEHNYPTDEDRRVLAAAEKRLKKQLSAYSVPLSHDDLSRGVARATDLEAAMGDLIDKHGEESLEVSEASGAMSGVRAWCWAVEAVLSYRDEIAREKYWNGVDAFDG